MLEDLFPGLAKGGYRVTSPHDQDYNCIAWAIGDTSHWWWPGPDVKEEFWPPGVPREVTVSAFLDTFALHGSVVCEGDQSEPGFLKVALFVAVDGRPFHAARQLPSGRWTSKLGKAEDIEHNLHDLAGDVYGSVHVVMKRPAA